MEGSGRAEQSEDPPPRPSGVESPVRDEDNEPVVVESEADQRSLEGTQNRDSSSQPQSGQTIPEAQSNSAQDHPEDPLIDSNVLQDQQDEQDQKDQQVNEDVHVDHEVPPVDDRNIESEQHQEETPSYDSTQGNVGAEEKPSNDTHDPAPDTNTTAPFALAQSEDSSANNAQSEETPQDNTSIHSDPPQPQTPSDPDRLSPSPSSETQNAASEPPQSSTPSPQPSPSSQRAQSRTNLTIETSQTSQHLDDGTQ